MYSADRTPAMAHWRTCLLHLWVTKPIMTLAMAHWLACSTRRPRSQLWPQRWHTDLRVPLVGHEAHYDPSDGTLTCLFHLSATKPIMTPAMAQWLACSTCRPWSPLWSQRWHTHLPVPLVGHEAHYDPSDGEHSNERRPSKQLVLKPQAAVVPDTGADVACRLP